MTTKTQLIHGYFTLSDATFSVGSNSASFTGGTRPIAGPTDGHKNEMTNALNGALAGSYAVYDGSTNRITLHLFSSNTITWGTATDLRDALGFTGDLSASTTHVAPNAPKNIWAPSRRISWHTGDMDEVWTPYSNTNVIVSSSGVVSTVEGPYSPGDAELRWTYLAKSEVVNASASQLGTFQTLFEDVIVKGERLIYFPDDTDTASYVTAIVGERGGVIGSFNDYAQRSDDTLDSYYDVNFKLLEYAS